MFYLFRQNNSGGSFEIDAVNIGPRVWIEADTPEEANVYAQALGIYFDGVENGYDCECCGDRWEHATTYDEYEAVKVYPEFDFNYHDEIYIHMKDGSVQVIKRIIRNAA